jgi:hypothetical protein
MPSCLDMLIMMPGGPLVLPQPYVSDAAIGEVVDMAMAFEDRLLPGWRDTRFLYLTVDRRFVEPGRTHRNGGWHFDGMQGARFVRKLPACHQYVVSDGLTTEFTDCRTDASGLDDLRHDFFSALGAQVPFDLPTFRPRPLEVVCMSAYQLHRSPVASEPIWRTFVRLDVSCKMQDRIGNTVNPSLPAPWEFVPRPLPEGLGTPIRDSSWAGARRFDDAA